jgi:hypothetical protein
MLRLKIFQVHKNISSPVESTLKTNMTFQFISNIVNTTDFAVEKLDELLTFQDDRAQNQTDPFTFYCLGQLSRNQTSQ